jgi:restriction system protein
MLPVLQAAAEHETRVPDVAARIADELHLSLADRQKMLPSGRQRVLHNRIHWAKFYMSKAGLIDAPTRGRFIASNLGRELLSKYPVRIDLSTLRLYPSFVEFYKHSAPQGGQISGASRGQVAAPSATPEEQIDFAAELLQDALKAEVLQRILALTPTFFERAIIELLIAMGYGGSHEPASIQLGKSGDGGVDGVIDEDRLGLDRIYIQAKRYAHQYSVGRPEIQSFVGSLVGLGASKGVFVTTSSFSNPAAEYVRNLPQRVVLIDGERLSELMIEYNVGTRKSRTVELKRIDEDFFTEE